MIAMRYLEEGREGRRGEGGREGRRGEGGREGGREVKELIHVQCHNTMC